MKLGRVERRRTFQRILLQYSEGYVCSWIGPHFCKMESNNYFQRYPNLINNDENLGVQPARKFQYLGCSGATASNVLADQVPLLKSPQMVTLSAGGNDADFATVLNYCVYQWMVVFWYSCDNALQDTQDKINSAAYTTDLTNLISAIKGRMKHPSNRIYWVGYGKYFGELKKEPSYYQPQLLTFCRDHNY